MTAERDYVLGTHEEELARLGLQHAVWRPRALDAWRRAGITIGQRVIDFGAGPGYATLDLADVVGLHGEIWALERSRRFLDRLEAAAAARGLQTVRTVEMDVATGAIPIEGADAAWCRWIFAFLSDPKSALQKLVRAVRPGGVIVIHEYIDYGAWRLTPRAPTFEKFVAAVMASWRESGGEPDAGLDLPLWLGELGCRIESLKPIADVVPPSNFVWQWPASFVDVNLRRMIDLGRITEAGATQTRAELAAAMANPASLMITPLVLEIVARRNT
jgi:SAM-dependent methyltransferase